MQEIIKKLAKKENLEENEATRAMHAIMSGKASDVQMSAYLCLLGLKGETITEITASARVIREYCVRVLHNIEALEIVGTGGDGSNSFNISTASALVVSSAKIPVAKHGNRSSSSKCGSADVLEALGANIMLEAKQSQALLENIAFCFLFAQNYHIAMRYVAPIRKELGIKTIFNCLGPLANPAGATMELMGVYDESLVEPLAEVMKNLGVKSGMVVYGMDGLDEISLSAETKVCEIKNNRLLNYYITPQDFGLKPCKKEDLEGGDAKENAKIIYDIFLGKEKGAKKDAVCLNAGAALYIANKVESLQNGITLARELIESKSALKQLETYIKASNQCIS